MDFFKNKYLEPFTGDPPMFITQQGIAYVGRFKNNRQDMTKADIPDLLADVIQSAASIVWQYQTFNTYLEKDIQDGLLTEHVNAWLFDIFRLCYDDPKAIPETVMVAGSNLQKQTDYLMDVFQAVPIIRENALSYVDRNMQKLEEDNIALHVDPYSGEILKVKQWRNQQLKFDGHPLVMHLKHPNIFYQGREFQEHNLYELTQKTLAETVERL